MNKQEYTLVSGDLSNEMIVSGSTNSILLKPTSINDKKRIFEWLAHSSLTSEMLGEPKFPDNPAPTWEEFDADYLDYFFDNSQPQKGRCFIIVSNDMEVGQINYNPINKRTKATELDIWLSDKKHTGKGIGTAAIKLLCSYLFEHMGCKKIVIQPSARNENAIKAYKKVGFMEQTKIPKNFRFDYYDSVYLELKRRDDMALTR